jgi:drug/metabolite transporter (DMT)-like permease
MTGQDSGMQEYATPKMGPAIGFALLAATLWGVSATVAADAFAEVPPTRVAQVRSLVALAFLLPYAWRRGLLQTQGAGRQLVVFGMALAIVHVTYYWAVERLGVGPGVTVQYLGPILVLVWMAVGQKRRVPLLGWLAGLLALAGTVMVTRAWDVDSLDFLGVLAGLGAAVTFAVYLLMGERLTRRLSAVTLLTYGFLVAAIFWAVVQPLWEFPTDISTKAWIELLWAGMGGTMVPFLAEVAALRRVSAGVVGVIASIEPVIAAVTAWWFLSQSLTAVQVAGGLLVVAAVATVQRWGVGELEVPLDSAR